MKACGSIEYTDSEQDSEKAVAANVRHLASQHARLPVQ